MRLPKVLEKIKTQQWAAALSCCSPPAVWWVLGVKNLGSHAPILLPSSTGWGAGVGGGGGRGGIGAGRWPWPVLPCIPAAMEGPSPPSFDANPQHIVRPGTLPGLLTNWWLRRCYWEQVMNGADSKSQSSPQQDWEKATKKSLNAAPWHQLFNFSNRKKRKKKTFLFVYFWIILFNVRKQWINTCPTHWLSATSLGQRKKERSVDALGQILVFFFLGNNTAHNNSSFLMILVYYIPIKLQTWNLLRILSCSHTANLMT